MERWVKDGLIVPGSFTRLIASGLQKDVHKIVLKTDNIHNKQNLYYIKKD